MYIICLIYLSFISVAISGNFMNSYTQTYEKIFQSSLMKNYCKIILIETLFVKITNNN